MRSRSAILTSGLLILAGCVEEPMTPRIEAAVSALLFNGRLQVGESQMFSGEQAQNLTIVSETGGSYVLVPFNASGNGDANLSVEIGGTTSSRTSLGPMPGGQNTQSLGAADAFHLALRETEIRELTPFIAGARRNYSRSAGAARAVPAAGDLLELNGSFSACTDIDARTGRVVAVTEQAIIVTDTANPSGGFNAAEYAALGDEFDDLIYPVDVENFGEPVDIDDNDRVIIFISRVVNELTEANSNSVIGGFFFSRDLFPRAQCAGSNLGELFYVLAPDPNGEVNGNVRSKDLILRITPGIIAHELQHLINASRRIYVNDASTFEESWLNEGLSHIAEELVFYELSGLEPGRNINLDVLRSSAQITNAVNRYQISNLGRYISYLEKPAEESLLGVDDLETRGAAWAFLRYAADLDEGPDQPVWFGLVNSQVAGIPNLQSVLETNPIDRMQTWTASVYTDDFVNTVSPLYQQPSWNFRSALPAINAGVFPLKTLDLDSGDVDLTLQPGGAAFIEFDLSTSERVNMDITSGGQVPPGKLRATVIRVR